VAVIIRLRRMGTRNRPYYRLVATDSRNARDGRFIEVLGYYHPLEKPGKIILEEDKIVSWLEKGAETSDTVNSLLKETGLLEKWARKKKGEDVSVMELKTTITERTKKRKVKASK
jgi:small subunit ribosomal protein S16